MPRTLAAFQRGLPVGVATPRSVNRLASRYTVACGSRYQSNSCATNTASARSTRTPAARVVKANPDKAQRAVRARVLTEGKVLYMAVPRLDD
jgi:hypothetical protein